MRKLFLPVEIFVPSKSKILGSEEEQALSLNEPTLTF
jgi:hypothetical protein